MHSRLCKLCISLPPSTPNAQVCVRCGKEKPAAAFNRNKVRPDGLCSYCKVCNAAAAAERRKTRQPVLEPTVSHKVTPDAATMLEMV